jgi:hypothetical protein
MLLLKRTTTLLFHLKLWLIAGIKMLSITGDKDGSRPRFARAAKTASAKRNGRTSTRTTVVLTTQGGLPFRLTVYQEHPPVLMIVLLLLTPSVNPLSTKFIIMLMLKLRTLNTNQKMITTALTASMTPSRNSEFALKDHIEFLKTNATTLI